MIVQNRPGEVFSAEVETGTTPLLLSIPALIALDAVIHMRERRINLGSLGVELPLRETRTKHLAMMVSYNPRLGIAKDVEGSPKAISINQDLFVYYSEEASLPVLTDEPMVEVPVSEDYTADCSPPQFGARGIRKDDVTGFLGDRRSAELAYAMKSMRLQDDRTWAALSKHYSLAEQAATKGFSTTVLFEPFGGHFGVTRTASREFSWTNSQPLDRLDGYDLLSPAGEELLFRVLDEHDPVCVLIAFDCRLWSLLNNLCPGGDWEHLRKTIGLKTLRLVKRICEHQWKRGRYFVVENPATSVAWRYHRILTQILEKFDGKYVICDQCRYGQRDSESGKLIRKPTGWLSNSEPILNHVGKRCQCPPGEHQQVLGSNAKGLRSRQAACYPPALCRAICKGLLQTMELDYAGLSAQGDLAYANLSESDAEGENMEVEEPMDGDYWIIEDNEVVRVHVIPRRHLFVPLATTGVPVPVKSLAEARSTEAHFVNGDPPEYVMDDWTQASEAHAELPSLWVGRTSFIFALPTQPEEQPAQAEIEVMASPSKRENVLRRRRARTRQLQRGLWVRTEDSDVVEMMQHCLDHYQDQQCKGWSVLNDQEELFRAWKAREVGQTKVRLILYSTDARRMRKPQPFLSAADAPMRKTVVTMANGDILSTGWEDWQQASPSSQIRPLPNKPRSFVLTMFGSQIDDEEMEVQELAGEQDQIVARETERQRKWDALPRELKMAVRRIQVNLGHCPTAQMMKALRISRASETALKACKLFRCPDCPRLKEPKAPRPSKLPIVDEFNVAIGMDVFEESDASGQKWSWLNILCQGSSFQVCCLLGETSKNPTSLQVLEAFEHGWGNWAGMPEHGIIVDRAKYFLSSLAEHMSHEGCHFDAAAKASPWQIGQVERAGGLWKAMFRQLCWSQQVSGKEDVLLATAAINSARNNLARKSGFAPIQWVLGRTTRLPADLMDEGEVARLGAQAAAETPTTRFFRKNQLRMAAREAFVKTANNEALRRAELRRVRPTRGPFHVGSYVFFYDQQGTQGSALNWRGVARVVGHEGSRIVWLSHRGILIAASPEHLSHANEEEIQGWMVTQNERELIDATPAAGGAGFLDLRQRPTPPAEGFPEEPLPAQEALEAPKDGAAETPALRDAEMSEGYEPTEAVESADENMPKEGGSVKAEDLSASSTSMARMKLESEREQKREIRSGLFFEKKQKERKALKEQQKVQRLKDLEREAVTTPVFPEFDPDLDDFRSPATTRPAPIPEEPEMDEAVERETKRRRQGGTEDGSGQASLAFAFHAYDSDEFLLSQAKNEYGLKVEYYQKHGLEMEEFLFGVERNDFNSQYGELCREAQARAYAAAPTDAATGPKKRGRKELRLNEITEELAAQFTGPGGSDEKEWTAWMEKGACDVLSVAESDEIFRTKSQCIIPTRWVRTNKNDGLEGKPFLPKSRLVVQGFKDKSLGSFRRDAPTASSLAESLCLVLAAVFGFVLLSKDVKNAYFSGHEIGRELYLQQPRGGLPGLKKGQLLRARKAIYGFSEAARLFWLALREHLLSDNWVESRLEPALFYLRDAEGQLAGVLVTHVDDIEAGVRKNMVEKAFENSSKALEFATSNQGSFIFRGREISQAQDGHVDVSMTNYAKAMKPVKIARERRQQLESRLTMEEKNQMMSAAGELGWITRQLRSDLSYENGCIQRCKGDPCVADLVRVRQAIAAARRAATFRQRYWNDVNLEDAVLVHMADAGHANGVPESDDIKRYQSIGGYFLFLANKEILEGKPARANLLAFHSSQTKRVCRSTLAAEASHLSEAVEAGDWLAVLLDEALHGRQDLKHWDQLVEKRKRVYVTDSQSVFDYLHRDSTSTSSDKRMAIEGALLRETVRRPGAEVKWIDGEQNLADILTKPRVDRALLMEYMRTGMLSLVQTEANRKSKEKKRAQRSARKKVVKSDEKKLKEKDARIERVVAEMRERAEIESEAEVQPKEKL